MSLIEILESGRQDFLEAIDGLTAPEALTKPAPDRWSVLECIEHVAVVEDRFLGWIANGSSIDPQPDVDNEARLFGIVTDRTVRVTAPEAAVPTGRFATVELAIAAFNAARDRSIRMAQEQGNALYAIGAKHPRFGALNGVEVVRLMAGHARRHAAQIRETRAALRNTARG